MNSQQKFHENDKPAQEARQKITQAMYQWRVRKLCAQDEYADVVSYRDKCELFSQQREKSNQRLKELQDEIDLCVSQLDAYISGNHKAKLVPDRLL